MTVLVTGGAGYIGGHVVAALQERGDPVVVVDDLSAGSAERLGGVPLETIDLAATTARGALADAMRRREVTAVIHLAARKKVPESVARPLYYADQNIGGTSAVLGAAQDAGVDAVVFSSTAAVYRSSDHPVTEESPVEPANPYGESKLYGEWMLRAQGEAAGVRGIALRYFNVTGASSPLLGDRSGTNIVPMAFERIEAGKPPLIFGDDYPTPDGTCVRDYIHVADVASAHLAALDALRGAEPGLRIYNIGTGQGTSVRQLLTAMIDVAGAPLEPQIAPRRPGDPAIVVADTRLIERELGWRPARTVEEALASAWAARRA
jgi:UDP-glucose 4-epimerase